MKIASMVLGIVGGVMAIVIAIVFIIMGGVMASLNSDNNFDVQIESSGFSFDKHGLWAAGDFDGMAFAIFNKVGIFFLIAGPISLIGGILGIIGGAIVRKKNKPAGVLMIIAAVLCASAIFTLGAIFALINDKKPKPALEAIEQ